MAIRGRARVVHKYPLSTFFCNRATTLSTAALSPVASILLIDAISRCRGSTARPVIAVLGQNLATRPGRRTPNTVAKLGLGFVLMTAAFGLFAVFSMIFTGQIPLIPVIVGMIAMGVTEVMYAPIGMSVASQLSPQAFTAQMMALWGLTTAAGASLSGFMGQFYTVSDEISFFLLLTLISLLTAVLLFALRAPLSRLGTA